jgi:hypothetical protein
LPSPRLRRHRPAAQRILLDASHLRTDYNMGHRKSSSASLGGQKLPRENLQDGEDVGRRAEAAAHGQGTNSNASGTGDNPGGSEGDMSHGFDAARSALLHSKQAELDAIEDRHDDLVRFRLAFVLVLS